MQKGNEKWLKVDEIYLFLKSPIQNVSWFYQLESQMSEVWKKIVLTTLNSPSSKQTNYSNVYIVVILSQS